jgi:hypothetical protein
MFYEKKDKVINLIIEEPVKESTVLFIEETVSLSPRNGMNARGFVLSKPVKLPDFEDQQKYVILLAKESWKDRLQFRYGKVRGKMFSSSHPFVATVFVSQVYRVDALKNYKVFLPMFVINAAHLDPKTDGMLEFKSQKIVELWNGEA